MSSWRHQVLETARHPSSCWAWRSPTPEWAEKQAEIKAKNRGGRRKAEEEAAAKEEAEREARIKASRRRSHPGGVNTRVSEALACP